MFETIDKYEEDIKYPSRVVGETDKAFKKRSNKRIKGIFVSNLKRAYACLLYYCWFLKGVIDKKVECGRYGGFFYFRRPGEIQKIKTILEKKNYWNVYEWEKLIKHTDFKFEFFYWLKPIVETGYNP